MWAWLSKLFDKKPASSPKPEAKRTDPPALRVVAPPRDDAPPFAAFLSLVGVEAPARSLLTAEEVADDGELAAQLLIHFRENKPAPSSLPAISLQVLNAVAEATLSLGELSRLIAQDPAMSAGVLKVANSPAFAGAQEIETLRDAVTRLGVGEVGRVAGMVAARSLFQPQVRNEFAAFGSKWSELFAESVVAARGAAWLAMRVKGINGDHVFLAGLLHDLGRSVALRSVAAVSLAGMKLDAYDPRVDRVLELVHCEVGGDVHQAWNLPRFPTLVAVRHHDLGLPGEGEYREVHVVRLCSAMVQFRRQGWRLEAIRAEIDESCAVLGLDGYTLRSLDTQLRTELQQVAQVFAEKPPRRAVP
jgi:HD-like signal output (HDOD) protein